MLLILPIELLVNVLERLEPRDVLRCSIVNRHLHNVVHSSTPLLYFIQLFLSGYVDRPNATPCSTSFGSKDRLSLLAGHQARWSVLSPSTSEKIGAVPEFDISGFYDGIFAGLTEREGRFVFSAYILGGQEDRVRRIEYIEPEGVRIDQFYLEPAQDLLVLVENASNPSPHFRIHLRTISTNAPHPLSAGVLTQIWSGKSSTMEVHQSHICIMFRLRTWGHPERQVTLKIWNWMTGDMVTDLTWNGSAIAQFHFTFLSEDVFLMSYSDTTVTPRRFGIQLYRIINEGGRAKRTVMCAIFLLPTLLPGASVKCMFFPRNHLSTSPPPPTVQSRPLPFNPDPSKALVLLQVELGGTDEMQYCCHFLVDRRIFLNELTFEGGAAQEPKIIQWENWSHAARVLSVEAEAFNWCSVACGSRYIRPVPPVSHILHQENSENGRHSLQLMDFNPLSMHLLDAVAGERSSTTYALTLPTLSPQHGAQHRDIQLVNTSSTICLSSVFVAPFSSSLPYVQVTTLESYAWSGVRFGMEHVLGIEMNEDDDTSLCVWTF